MKHGTHWNGIQASGIDSWTLIKTANFSKKASGNVLLRCGLWGLGGVANLALKVESDYGVVYNSPYANYGTDVSTNNLIATIPIVEASWLKVYIKKSTAQAGGCTGAVAFDNGGLWFDRVVNDISWV